MDVSCCTGGLSGSQAVGTLSKSRHALPSSRHHGAQVKALRHGDGGDVRALDHGETPVNARSVQSYLQHAFGPRLPDAERALQVPSHRYLGTVHVSGLCRGCCMRRAGLTLSARHRLCVPEHAHAYVMVLLAGG